MGEYQYVAFRAVDRPLSDRQLEFAERQSSRAEVTRWSYNVEYHYSSFRGDVDGLLRGGYDVFLSYCNYGSREIRLRLPAGFPFAKKIWAPYFDDEHLIWKKDRQGPGGILSICPYLEDEFGQVWDFGRYLDVAVQVRGLLIAADLRALYLLWLCAAGSTQTDLAEVIEPPVPHGLGKLPSRTGELLDFFESDPLLVRAAASGVPARAASGNSTDSWAQSLPALEARQIVGRLLTEDAATVKADVVARANEARGEIAWPCEKPGRTVADLMAQSAVLRQAEDLRENRKAEAQAKRAAAKAEKQRQTRMKKMVAAPQEWLRQADALVGQRGTENYRAAADILADLREALGDDEGDRITRKHAAHLVRKHPTLNVLKSSLRKKSLLN